MSEAPSPKQRRFWQLHLSTKLFCGLISVLVPLLSFIPNPLAPKLSYGWPYELIWYSSDQTPWFRSEGHSFHFWIVVDVAIGIFIIAATTIAFEYFLRRREAEGNLFQIHLSTIALMTIVSGLLIPILFWAYSCSPANLSAFYWMFAACLLALLYIGRIFEWLIRRRESRRP